MNTAISDARKYPNMDTNFKPSIIQQQVLKIGIVSPVDDFNAMIQSIGEEDMVGKAVEEMHVAIFKLLNRSFGNQHYQKVHDCLQTFREAATRVSLFFLYNYNF
jgi:hypothetical protein